MALTGDCRVNSGWPGRTSRPRSWPAPAAVVPTFRKLATSDMLASPTITCRRRYFWASQCGSSRVLTIGRLRVVSRPDLLLEEVGPLGELEVDVVAAGRRRPRMPTLPGAGEDLAGDEVRHDVAHDAGEGHGPVHQVVLVGAVGVALAVGVVLQHDQALARRQQPGWPPPWTGPGSARRPCRSGSRRGRRRTPGWSTPGGRGRRSSGPRW